MIGVFVRQYRKGGKNLKRVILSGVTIAMLSLVSGCGLFGSPSKPSWLTVSAQDVSSIEVQGWGPGADGNYVIHPAAGQSAKLIDSLVHQLSKDKAIKSHQTGSATGGAHWLKVQLKNGSSITFADFPNDFTPVQYIVTLKNKSGKQESSLMISDVSGGVSSAINDITNNGTVVRQKPNS